jgi:hypothetical protein
MISTRDGMSGSDRPGRLGDDHATAAGIVYSNRVVGGSGATHGTDRSISHGRLCHLRPALYGVDVHRHGVCLRRANGSCQDAALAWRLLRFLRGRPRRRHRRRSASPHFCNSAASIPAGIMAGSRRPDAGHSSRLELPSARATAGDLTRFKSNNPTRQVVLSRIEFFETRFILRGISYAQASQP